MKKEKRKDKIQANCIQWRKEDFKLRLRNQTMEVQYTCQFSECANRMRTALGNIRGEKKLKEVRGGTLEE